MDRFISHWKRYYPDLEARTIAYLMDHGKIVSMARARTIKYPFDLNDDFYFVLEGVVGSFGVGLNEDIEMMEIFQEMEVFSSTFHPFTTRNQPVEFRTITAVRLLKLQNQFVRQAQLEFPAFSELLQVAKQRKLNQLRGLIQVYQEKRAFNRVLLYYKLFPDWPKRLPDHIQILLLRLSKATYYRIKTKLLFHKIPKKYK